MRTNGKIRAGIIGATGYAGVELVRLLLRHPGAELAALSSESFLGEQIESVYPSLLSSVSEKLVTPDEVIARSECVFASLPHGLSQQIAAQCDAQGRAFIDLGADFRLDSEDEYRQWYGGAYEDRDLHSRAVYGLCELFRDEIQKTRVIGNPGCYPTSIALALAPALRGGLILPGHIIIDSKSGVTGAGRGLTQGSHFPEANEAFSAYKIAQHRHTPEIEQTLTKLAGEQVRVTFVPHLLPVNRGILSTIYAQAAPGTALEPLRAAYRDFYRAEPFVRVVDKADIKYVKYSNYCDISVQFDERTGAVILISAIDNMVKGAAGQAIQNMNLIFGLEETCGLEMVPPAF